MYKVSVKLKDCHVYMEISDTNTTERGNILVDDNGNLWSPPAVNTPVGPNSGHLRVNGLSCTGCSDLQDLVGQCGTYWTTQATFSASTQKHVIFIIFYFIQLGIVLLL